MVFALGIIIFVIGCCLSAYEDNSYKAQRMEEELMRLLKEPRNSPPPAPRKIKQVRRRFAQDKDGNILGEEITEEDYDDYSDSETRAARGGRDYFTDDPSDDYNSYYAQVADDAMMGDSESAGEIYGEFGEGEW